MHNWSEAKYNPADYNRPVVIFLSFLIMFEAEYKWSGEEAPHEGDWVVLRAALLQAVLSRPAACARRHDAGVHRDITQAYRGAQPGVALARLESYASAGSRFAEVSQSRPSTYGWKVKCLHCAGQPEPAEHVRMKGLVNACIQ